MTPSKRNAGPLAGPGAATHISPHDRTEQPDRTTPDTTPVVFGTRLLASGDAHYDRILVRRCVWCSHPHIHILFEHGAQVIERAPACAKHRTYSVEITDVVPAVPGRSRGAA